MGAVVDVLVPVLGRPGRSQPFMRTLRRSGALERVTVTAIYSPWDRRTSVAWRRAGADVYACPTGDSWAQKVNAGYRARGAAEFTAGPPAPWLLLVGDDVRFHEGWLDAALAVAEATGADVVGTNDLGERSDGENAVHPLIRRSYVDERGASWDGPGVVCHEGYDHHYTDAELSHVSRERGVWAPAPLAVIEHMHWRFGRSECDDTYLRGARAIRADRRLFYDRCDAHAQVPPPRPDDVR